LTLLAIGVVGAGLLLAGCQQIAGTPVAAAGPALPASAAPSSTVASGPLPASSVTDPPVSAAESSAGSSGAGSSGAGSPDAGSPDAASSDAGSLDAGSPDAGASAVDPQSADPTAYPEGDGVDPCRLVGKADAEKLAGTRLDPPVHGQHSCTYTGPVTGPTAQVEVYVGLGAKKQLDIERTLGHELHPLAGVGDEAWISDTGVYLRSGQLWVSVLVVLLEDPSQYAKRLGDVASIAAGRL
jgi:hypothetical protein